MSLPASELMRMDGNFKEWIDELIARLHANWSFRNDAWTMFFEDAQLIEVGKQLWALHALARAYPWPVELVRLVPGDAYDKSLCSTTFNLNDDDEYNPAGSACVAFVVFPGFLLDETIEPCDAFCFEIP
jgi:hypothetical protein